MQFRVESDVGREPAAVFAFLRDIDRPVRDPRSVVPVLEKTSAGETGLGSTFRELVRIVPGRNAEVRSEITAFEPAKELDYRFTWRFAGARMDGTLQYKLEPNGRGGTHLVQLQSLEPRGALRLVAPLIRWTFARRVAARMRALREEAERAEVTTSTPPRGTG